MSARTWPPEVAALGDRIAALTAAEAAELRRYLADAHGVRAPDAPAPPADEPPTPDVVVPVRTEWGVRLDRFDAPRKLGLIKAVRDLLGLGVREARDLVEAAPRVVREGLPRDEAEALKARLEASGATASVV
jgi:large subunit ribosomal protein L7/L12